VAALLHGITWALLLLLSTAQVAVLPLGFHLLDTRTFRDFNMKLPAATMTVLDVGRWVSTYWIPCLAIGAFLLILDVVVLRALDRPGAARILRELWAGLLLILPVVGLVYAAYALSLPSVKFMEGVTYSADAYNQAAQAERRRLDGRWKLVGLERDGTALPADKVPAERLTLEGNHFTWVLDAQESAGTYGLRLRRLPKEIDFMHGSGPAAGQYQVGLYKLEGDRLTLCLAPPDTFGDDLPTDFTTRGTHNELEVWERQR
jgi:uncharacterized protein (TIGR03067 family)